MKKQLLLSFLIIFVTRGLSAQIAINSTNTPPNPTAMLDIDSPTKGLLIPRMTAFQKAAINPVPTGLMVYDATLNQFSYFNGSIWIDVSGASGSPWTVSSPNSYYNNSGNVGIGITNPATKLHVSSSINGDVVLRAENLGVGGYGVYGRTVNGGIGVYGEAFGGNAIGGYFLTNGGTERSLFAETINGGTASYFNAPNGKALIVNEGNVGIGNTNPTKAKLIVDSSPSSQTNAIFGSNGQGISFQKNWPTIGFNSYRENASTQKYMADGYAFVNSVNQSDGTIFWNKLGSGVADGLVGASEEYVMGLSQSGNLNIKGKYSGGVGIVVGVGSSAGVLSNTIGTFASASGVYSTSIGFTTVASGDYSLAMGANSTASSGGAIAIGSFANASGGGSVSIGNNATSSGGNSFAIGNQAVASGFLSTAIGFKVEAFGTGSFIIGDSDPDNEGFSSGLGNRFDARFKGGYYFRTSGNTANIGVRVVSGGNAWTTISDSTKKHNLLPVNGEDFLQKIAKLKLSSWNYKTQDAKIFRHYGPMAQDFFNAFGKDALGTIGCDTLINQADFDGVNLIAIQALERRTQQIQTENASLKNELNALLRLKDEMAEIKAMLQKSGNSIEKVNIQAEK